MTQEEIILIESIINKTTIVKNNEIVDRLLPELFHNTKGVENEEEVKKILLASYIVGIDSLDEMIQDYETDYGFIIPSEIYSRLNIKP